MIAARLARLVLSAGMSGFGAGGVRTGAFREYPQYLDSLCSLLTLHIF